MQRQMVHCEDGRERQARVHGIPREENNFLVMQAGVRVKGKHVTGEAWQSLSSGIWYFLTGPAGKNNHLLPRFRPIPEEAPALVHRSLTIRKA